MRLVDYLLTDNSGSLSKCYICTVPESGILTWNWLNLTRVFLKCLFYCNSTTLKAFKYHTKSRFGSNSFNPLSLIQQIIRSCTSNSLWLPKLLVSFNGFILLSLALNSKVLSSSVSKCILYCQPSIKTASF